MPAAVLVPLIAAGATATGSIVAAKMQGGAADDAAKLNTDAAKYAADKQDAAAQRTEAFNREQADYAAQQAEVDRHANYDQYAANRRRIGSIGQMLGLGGVEVPSYVPGVVPHYSAAPAAAPPRPTTIGAAMSAPPQPAPPGAPGLPTPVLQPDGTYALPSSMPRVRTFGQYLGAA